MGLRDGLNVVLLPDLILARNRSVRQFWRAMPPLLAFALFPALHTMMRMSFRKEKPPAAATPASVANEIAWEYDDETAAYRRPGSRSVASSPPASDARTQRVQRSLDAALDAWWRRGVLPPDELLRDGLLVLEAGHDLDESHRTLLLRTALARRRGMLTALRYQSDPERTAVVLEDALFQATPPLSVAELQRLHQSDAQSNAWAALLGERLRTIAVTDPMRRSQAAAALAALSAAPTPPTALEVKEEPAPPLTPTWVEGEAVRQQRRHWLWVMGAVAAVAVIAGAVVWWQRSQDAGMIDAPAGSYTVTLKPDGAAEVVELPAFRIDRFEATVADYRRCYERGACPWPATTASATRPGYLLDPAFSRFPMINLDYDSAARFCRFMGKRLPTAAEWEVAAAFAPATHRMFRYPWGDEFAVQRANSAALGIGDTMQVGSFQPAGDSPLGASDMAGNVAEWTATAITQDGATLYLVKGGSFADAAEDLRTTALNPTAPRTAANWLGVRCAADRQ